MHRMGAILLGKLDESWRKKALCKNMTNMFHPVSSADEVYPKRVCSSCPVRMECLNFAIVNQIQDGIWGGFNYRERLKIRKRQIVIGENSNEQLV